MPNIALKRQTFPADSTTTSQQSQPINLESIETLTSSRYSKMIRNCLNTSTIDKVINDPTGESMLTNNLNVLLPTTTKSTDENRGIM